MSDTGAGRITVRPQYIGISGATNDLPGGNGFINAPIHPQFNSNNCCGLTAQGLRSRGGVMVSARSIHIKDISDGTSNTIMVGECSDFGKDSAGLQRRINNNHGWLMGTVQATIAPSSRTFNLTTIRYAPNSVNKIGGITGVPGVGNNDGANNGLYSPHAGGVHALRCDGSVFFMSESIDMLTLKLMATRDDGRVFNY